ncbi:family 43 glycosylhydrolase, partial [Balneolaceae bacterium ANBcel3]|nr:family 43 glycosylhydrolase [Balneolaceae bacterium ANBcel3]
TVASLEDFEWSDVDNGAWAPQAIERNGKFYLYCPIHGDGIGVLVADRPYGPFKDPIGERLVESSYIWDDIDPTVFIDDDGQAYLYWGNPVLYYAKLNEDMISVDRSIGDNGVVAVEMTPEAFGEREEEHERYTTNYEEGPWLYKRGDLYYMVFAAVGIPEYIAYSTAPTATGPWTYRGIIMGRHPGLAFTNHPGVIDYKGNSYLFYHNEELPGGGGFNRSISVEQFEYNADGSIPRIIPTKQGIVQGVAHLNPYGRVEAETIAWSSGVTIDKEGVSDVFVTSISDGDHIKVRSVDFGSGAQQFKAVVASGTDGGFIDIRLDSANGRSIGSCEVNNTGGELNWQEIQCNVDKVEGIHDLIFVFRGEGNNLFNFDWWSFSK